MVRCFIPLLSAMSSPISRAVYSATCTEQCFPKYSLTVATSSSYSWIPNSFLPMFSSLFHLKPNQISKSPCLSNVLVVLLLPQVQPKLAQLLSYQSHNLVETKYLQRPLQSPNGVISITHQVLNSIQGWPLVQFLCRVYTLLLLIYLQRCDEECTTACRPQNLTSNRFSSGSTEIQPIRKPSWACQARQQLSLRTLLCKTNWHMCS